MAGLHLTLVTDKKSAQNNRGRNRPAYGSTPNDRNKPKSGVMVRFVIARSPALRGDEAIQLDRRARHGRARDDKKAKRPTTEPSARLRVREASGTLARTHP